MKFLGHPSRPKAASHRANANCLKPQAEFSRASGRGLRRVKKFIQPTKGMRKKAKLQNICLNRLLYLNLLMRYRTRLMRMLIMMPVARGK